MLLKNEEIEKEHFDLNVAIREVIAMLSNEIKENDFHITEHYASDYLPVYAGHIEVQLVVLNLMTNAVKAMKGSLSKKRRLSISTGIDDHAVQVKIVDTVPGISDDLFESLFERFVSDGKDGLGMGLAMCRKIIESFGGRIRADNAEAGGAIISFTLPLESKKSIYNGS